MEEGAANVPPTQPPPAGQPTCWKCGYLLTGLRVEGSCPECGTPIWGPRTETTQADRLASQMLTWGIVSLCLTFVCLGPLAALLTIPVYMANRKFRAMNASGATTPSQAKTAHAGLICARITLWVSLALVVVYMLMFVTRGF